MAAPDPPADPDRYDEAVRAFRRRVPMTDPEFRKLEADERQRAFWVAGVTQARVVQEIKDALERAVRDGTTLEDFKAQAGGKLAEAWGGEDAPRLDTVFRTNVLGAYNGGRTEIFDDPIVREARPYLRFDAVKDSRVTDICSELDGTVLPADDPFWEKHTPPLHFNCRSILTPLSAEEAEDEGISKGPPDTHGEAPTEGFGRPQRSRDQPEPPDLSKFDPEIRDIARERISDPPPPPAPRRKVDYGPLLPALPSAPLRGQMIQPKRVTFDIEPGPPPSDPAAVQRFIERNQLPLRELGRQVREQSGIGDGVDRVRVRELKGGAIGEYSPLSATVSLSPRVARDLATAISRGEVTTYEQLEAVRVLLHEMWHASSNPRYRYRDGDGSKAMEEGTTEFLAQHLAKSFAEDSLGLRVAGSLRRDDESILRASSYAGVDVARPVAYLPYVAGLGKMVAFVDQLDLGSMMPAEIDSHVAGRALQAKQQTGTAAENVRYGMFVRPLLERYNVLPSNPRYQEITRELTELLGRTVESGSSTPGQLERDVTRIVGDRSPS